MVIDIWHWSARGHRSFDIHEPLVLPTQTQQVINLLAIVKTYSFQSRSPALRGKHLGGDTTKNQLRKIPVSQTISAAAALGRRSSPHREKTINE